MTLTISVIVPCFNEASTIGSVVRDFRQALPEASVFVYDNNSTDSTVETASAAGAIVRKASLQGKGHVVRRMFADIDSDLYVMVDGDDTYDAGSAEEMIRCLTDEQHDMVIGRRVSTAPAAYRAGHRWGNRVLTALVGWVFGSQFKDMLSGYRVFSRRFVKSFPVMTHGFEIETELAVHALELSMSVAEVDTQYKERPLGSVSKLHTYRDGFRILRIIAFLIKDERPMQFFSIVAVLLGLGLGFTDGPNYCRIHGNWFGAAISDRHLVDRGNALGDACVFLRVDIGHCYPWSQRAKASQLSRNTGSFVDDDEDLSGVSKVCLCPLNDSARVSPVAAPIVLLARFEHPM